MIKQRDPAVQTVLKELVGRIHQGHYQPGSWLPSERELAAEFDVPRAVVRAALTGLAEQSLIVRQPGRRPWIADALPPMPMASRRRSNQSKVIMTIMPQHTKFASALMILRGINRVLRHQETPYRLAVFDNYGETPTINIEEERIALQTALADEVAGVILWSMNVGQTLPDILRLREHNIPVVFVDRHSPDIDGDFVGIDNQHAAQEIVEHLLDLGHRRIGYLTVNEAGFTTTTQDRCIGYQEALRRRGLHDPELIYILNGQTQVRPVDYFLGLKDPATAVFANNDTIAYGLIGAIESKGLRVPEDLSVAGFDDIDRFSPRSARLTTVQQPFEQIGRRAMELLLRRLHTGENAWSSRQHILLPTS
ncbi:MAG TPA: GntR family transcriptional regulator, partial [Chthonomonadaceae bacterium]|nr:GntR family transcriptional regulator [Chthonomonadaceae bacterium]